MKNLISKSSLLPVFDHLPYVIESCSEGVPWMRLAMKLVVHVLWLSSPSLVLPMSLSSPLLVLPMCHALVACPMSWTTSSPGQPMVCMRAWPSEETGMHPCTMIGILRYTNIMLYNFTSHVWRNKDVIWGSLIPRLSLSVWRAWEWG